MNTKVYESDGSDSEEANQAADLKVSDSDIEAFHDRHANLDYSILVEFDEFTHRGETVVLDQLIGTLEYVIEMESVNNGDTSEAGTLVEYKAVSAVVNELKAMYPLWFSSSGDIDGQPLSESRLMRAELIDRYYDGLLDPHFESVEGDNREDKRRVVVPLVTITLEEIAKQMEADRAATIEEGKEQIKKAVVRQAHGHDLDEEAINEAVESAKEILGGR